MSVEENGRTGRLNSTGASVANDAILMEANRNVRARLDENVALPEHDNVLDMHLDEGDMSTDESVDNVMNLLAPADSSVSDSLLETDKNNKSDEC